MAKTSESKFKRIKRSHIWSTLIELIVFAAVSVVILVTALRIFGAYIIETKMAAEYEKISYMARMYDNSLRNDDTNIYNLLVEEGRDYIITDADGDLIHLNGENTCSDESGVISISGYDEDVLVYRDSERGFAYPGRDGSLKLDIMGFREWLGLEENIDEKEFDIVYEDRLESAQMINLPIWISMEADNGNRYFIGKALFSANKRDIDLLMTLVIAIISLIGIILITMLAAAIKNIIRQRRMINLYFTDIVTDGHNWAWFLQKGSRRINKSGNTVKYAIASLAMVNYRNYCLCHSVAEGERLITEMYKSIELSLHKKELCAHTTSSTFALMLKYNDIAELKSRIEELYDKLNAIDTDHTFSFHTGIALTENAADKDGNRLRNKDIDLDTEYNNASAARATLEGSDDSGIVIFDDKLLEENRWVDKVQERQQAALDNEEFVVYYQPKYDPRTNELKGAEALIRWDSKELGFVPPGRFIPIFEKNGFITKIDHYMIRHVAADQKAWLDKGCRCVPVSVNVSRAHFIEDDLAEQIRDMVDAAGTPHEYIEIELTESAFFDDKKAMLNTIGRLKNYGFAVSMDDFGSGYSSLNSLKDMPLDVLKLDAEFFRGETGDKRGEIVVSEAIKLAKNLNMRIVAEGVEVKDQVDFLAGEGCDMIQGYYFAKPMPKSDYEERMSKAVAI